MALYGEFTLRETLMYFGWIAGMQTAEIDEKIDFLMQLLQLPSVTRFVKSLSGGQQRRMSLAAALLHGTIFFILNFHFDFHHWNVKTNANPIPDNVVMKCDYIICRT